MFSGQTVYYSTSALIDISCGWAINSMLTIHLFMAILDRKFMNPFTKFTQTICVVCQVSLWLETSSRVWLHDFLMHVVV